MGEVAGTRGEVGKVVVWKCGGLSTTRAFLRPTPVPALSLL